MERRGRRLPWRLRRGGDPEGFRAWLDGLERAGARIWNPPDLVRWNLSKRYLHALQAAGVPTVPTVILEAGTPDGFEAVMARHGWRAAHDTRLVTDRTVAEATAALETGEIRRPVMIQPFVEEIQSRGEWPLVFIDSAFTHAVIKRPAAGDFRVQPRLGGTVQAAPAPDAHAPPAAERFAEALLRAL